MSTITVITPTAGKRPGGLKRLIELLDELLRPGDEHLVVWDVDKIPDCPPSSRFTKHHRFRDMRSIVGNVQRDFAMAIAAGDWLMFCDDDDLPTKSAIDHIHSLEPTVYDAHIYTMVYPSSQEGLLADPVNVQYGRIGGPQIVLPNEKNSGLGWFKTNVYASDFELISEASRRYSFVFHPDIVICLVRPFEDYIKQVREAQKKQMEKEAASENLGSA